MRTEGARKHFLLAFLFALILYAIFYAGIEHLRTRKGAWEVRFGITTDHAPSIAIDQKSLAICNVQITFPGQAALSTNVITIFNQPRPVPYDVPFGQCIFMDTTFLPGTVTFRLFGHEIELLPRVLIIDHEEHPWKSGNTIRLAPVAPASTK
jgi:hypothetical protein